MTLLVRPPRFTRVKAFMLRLSRFWWLTFLCSLAGMLLLVCSFGRIVDLQITKAFHDLDAFETSLELYRKRFGDFPTAEQGLAALVGTTLRRVPRDPWGSAYVYSRPSPSIRPFVYSIGVDEIDSGGAGDDVSSRDKEYRCEAYGVNCSPDFEFIGAITVIVTGLLSLLLGLGRGIFWLAKLTRHEHDR